MPGACLPEAGRRHGEHPLPSPVRAGHRPAVGGGPDLARWPLAPSGTSLYWTALNKGKRSVTLNLREAEGRRLFGELLAASGPGGGTVLTNATGQGWLAYSELVQIRPDLIHLQIQGHRDGRAAVDYTVNAATGFPLITGPEGFEGPVNHVLPAWDVACGLYAAVGLLAAERKRQRTGAGSEITLALADVALAVAGHLGFLAEAQVNGAERPRIGNHLYGGFARDFLTSDGERVMVVALPRRHFADLAAVRCGSRTARPPGWWRCSPGRPRAPPSGAASVDLHNLSQDGGRGRGPIACMCYIM
jgi:2-methylfumaryl-CoA isomerase